MAFIKQKISKLDSSKRLPLPREWSPKDHYFYKQCIHQAQSIGFVPSSIAYRVAEIVRETSVLKSDWKKIARSLGMNNEGQLKVIEDVAGGNQEFPLYIALTAQYKQNPAASLGGLLESLMKLKRYDILIKIKDDVQDAIHESNGLKVRSSFHSRPKSIPVEEESAESLGHPPTVQDKTLKSNKTKSSVNASCSNYLSKHSESECNCDSAFYDHHSRPNSLLEILSRNEITKNDYSFDYCYSSYERDRCDKKPNWKNVYENKENFVGKKTLSDTAGTVFEFIDHTNKNRCITTNIADIELNAENSSAHLDEVIDNSPPSVSRGVEETKEYSRSEECYDSDTTCDEDLVINLQEISMVNSCNQDTETSTLLLNGDNRKKENERRQYLSISEYEPESAEIEDNCGGTDFESYDKDNVVNERIAHLVAVKDENLRNVEKAERESISALHSVKIQESTKNPHDYFLSLMRCILPSDISINIATSIIVIVVHSEQDSDTATAIAAGLVKQFKMAAVAECQLIALWLIDPSYYKGMALQWADVVVPLITNKWLEDIGNERPLIEREAASLDTRSVFKQLQNLFLNRGSVNLSSVPVVIEGTSRRFINYPEIRDAIKLSKDFRVDGSISKLGELIKGFHSITRDAKKPFLEYM